MKTDISKLLFDESKHYLGVFEQMGRVRLASDANDEAEIALRRDQRHAADTVRTGSPNNGFRVDTYLLLHAMDDRADWVAEKANPADPEPQLYVDYFDHRTGQGSIKLDGAAALVHAPVRPVDLRDLREVVFAAKGTFASNEVEFFLGQGGVRHQLATAEDAAEVKGWRIFRADPSGLPPGFDLASVEEYGFASLNSGQNYAIDYIKVDRPIREVLVPTKSLAFFEADPVNPGVVPRLSVQDDDRIWKSTVLAVSDAASVRYTLPRRRDLTHVSAIVYAARSSQAGVSLTVRLIDEDGNTHDLNPLNIPAADVWTVDSQSIPGGVIDPTRVEAIEWRSLNGDPFLLSPLILEMERTGNLIIMGGDGSADGAGRFYGDGLAAIKETHETYFSQWDLPEAASGALDPPANNTQRIDLAYLDLWERPVTYIEDPELREVALEGPDSTTRTRLIAQVRILNGEEVALAETPQPPSQAFAALPPCGSGTLTTKDNPNAASDPCADPCEPEVVGTFLGDANRLYRIEIYRCGDIGAEGDAGTATFTWSKENAAVASALLEDGAAGAFSVRVEKPDLFAIGDLIEIADDRVDLATGPFEDTANHRCHQRGELRRISSINLEEKRISWQDAGAPNPAFHTVLVHSYRIGYHPKIRRWDGVTFVTAGDIVLEDGVVIEFGGDSMAPGDFWVFFTRTIDASVERLIEEPARGICHRYYKLAAIERRNDNGTETIDVEDCRATFRPLTELRAADVGYDPGLCLDKDPQWAEVSNVQEAIDAICRLDLSADIKLHNKMLHGYGVVCGLKIRCHGNRLRVIIEPGYALDCEGCGVHVNKPIQFDAVAEAQALDLLDPAGSGEICLTIAKGVADDAVIAIEAHEPAGGFFDGALEGTLLKDFIEHCILNIFEFFKDQFTPLSTKPPVSDANRRLISIVNLFWQLINAGSGRNVFVSHGQPGMKREYELLRTFYTDLRNLLASETFCAMFDNARPFPDYPKEFLTDGMNTTAIDTVFGLTAFHTKLKLHPTQPLAYSYGSGSMIQVFSLKDRELVETLEFPAGDNVTVQDVAVSADGDRVHAVATVNNRDESVFATATLQPGNTHTWGPTTVVCDIKFVTLATNAKRGNNLYAIGKSDDATRRGLFVFTNPANIPVEPTPSAVMNPTGLLAIQEDGGVAYLAVSSLAGQQTSFDNIAAIDLDTMAGPLVAVKGSDAENDIVHIDFNNGLLCVTGDPAPGHTKTLYVFSQVMNLLQAIDLQENTITKLAGMRDLGALLVTLADQNKAVRVDLKNFVLDPAYRIPLQVFPTDIAFRPGLDEVYALNLLGTISVVDVAAVIATNTPPVYTVEPFVSDPLGDFRQEMIDAYADLLGGLGQYLKDCFCDQFLIDCPECTPDDKIYLGCVEIRNGQVYHICNFTKRRWVKSVATNEYWESVFPIRAIIKKAFADFCCKVF